MLRYLWTLAAGEVVEVIDSVVTSAGRVRIRINGPWRDNGAWASMISTDGAVLFQAFPLESGRSAPARNASSNDCDV